jgi:peptidoglycan/xylan/chitin deacetylase (PgdA/CDA1 family)
MNLSQIKRATKHAVRRAAIRGGLEATSLARHILPGSSKRAIVFTLHHVRPPSSEAFQPNAPLEVTPEFLGQAIATVKDAGRTLVHVDELPDLLAKDGTETFASFTLDDGCRDNFDYALPVFKAHGAPFTIFVTAGFAERKRSMWWLTIEELLRRRDSISFDFGNGVETLPTATTLEKFAASERFARLMEVDEERFIRDLDALARESGFDPLDIVARETMDIATLRELVREPLARLGAHTLTHPNLARVSAEQLATELKGSADKVEEYVGVRPRALAYPYGSRAVVGAREAAAAKAAGFTVALTTQPGLIDNDTMKAATMLPRVSLNGYFQKPRYVRSLMSGLPFLLMR